MWLALDHDLRVLARDAVVEQPDLRLLAAADDGLLALDLVHLAHAGAGEHDQVGAVALAARRRHRRRGHLRGCSSAAISAASYHDCCGLRAAVWRALTLARCARARASAARRSPRGAERRHGRAGVRDQRLQPRARRGGESRVLRVGDVVGVLERDAVGGRRSAPGPRARRAPRRRRSRRPPARRGTAPPVFSPCSVSSAASVVGRGLAQIARLPAHHSERARRLRERARRAQELAAAAPRARPPRRSSRTPASAGRRPRGSRSPRRTPCGCSGGPRRKSSSSIAGRSSWISE